MINLSYSKYPKKCVLWHVCRKFGPSHVESEITLPRVNAHISLDTLNSSDLSSSRSYLSISLVFHIPFFWLLFASLKALLCSVTVVPLHYCLQAPFFSIPLCLFTRQSLCCLISSNNLYVRRVVAVYS